MKINERDKEYLFRIIEHCERIEDVICRFGDSYKDFSKDQVYQDAVNMNIFQIGELANHLSEDLCENMQSVPWEEIIGIRNIIAHGYIGIDNKIIWETAKNDIPFLKTKIKEYLK